MSPINASWQSGRPRGSLKELAARHVRAWYFLVGTLGLHVLDEATTGFLDFYNSTVLRVRAVWAWFPMPTFRFGVWFVGLAVLVFGLALVGPLVRRGVAGTRCASWLLSAIMLLNGVGHLLGSAYFGRWLPGTTSAPLLLLGSTFLAIHTWRRRVSASVIGAPHPRPGEG